MSFLCSRCYTYYPDVTDNFCPKCQMIVEPMQEGAAPPDAIATEITLGKLPTPVRLEPLKEEPISPELDVTRAALLDRIRLLERRVEELERGGHTNLTSHSFFARAFAVFGHWLVAYLVIVVPLFVLGFCTGVGRR